MLLNFMEKMHQNSGVENDTRDYFSKKRNKWEKKQKIFGLPRRWVLFGFVLWRYVWDFQELKDKPRDIIYKFLRVCVCKN